jgi:hypothetical protein
MHGEFLADIASAETTSRDGRNHHQSFVSQENSGIDESHPGAGGGSTLAIPPLTIRCSEDFCGASDLRTSARLSTTGHSGQYLCINVVDTNSDILIPSSQAWWTTATAIGTNSSLNNINVSAERPVVVNTSSVFRQPLLMGHLTLAQVLGIIDLREQR